jgi:hypothetical protein
MRGLYQRFTGSDDPPHPAYHWIFSGMSVPLFRVPDKNPSKTDLERNAFAEEESATIIIDTGMLKN